MAVDAIQKRSTCQLGAGLGEPVLIEFGCGFHPRAWISSGATAIALRLASAIGGRAQDLEADLLQGMGEERRLSSRRVSTARLRACSLSRAALAPLTRVSSSRIEASRALSAKRGSRFMKPPAGVDPARRDAYGDRRGAVPCGMLEIQYGAPEIYSPI